jgi:cytochrome c-type biogenesis protein CcmH/NrfG
MKARPVASPFRLAWALLACLPFAAATLAAQRSRPSPVRQAGIGDRRSQAIRAEYAAVLLQSGRYAEAAQEYRRLLASDPRQAEYRLALARALAWGGESREAERELRALRAQRPGDASVTALLRSTRESYEPTAREAELWLADEPSFAPYRLALARALVREGAPRAALPHYDLLLALGRPIESRPVVRPAMLLRESAETRAAGGDRPSGVRLLRDALARSPGDTTIRHALAVVLTAGGDLAEALAQYDTLLSAGSERALRASLLLERAQVHVARGDLDAAGGDARASLATSATAEGFLLLGDLARWRGQYAEARTSYERARELKPDSRNVRAAFDRLARDEHPALAFAPIEGVDEGWRAEGSGVGDNLGVRYFTAGARRGIMLPANVTASAGVEYRQLSEHSDARSLDLRGYAAEVGASSEAQLGALYGRLGAHAGVVSHPGLGAFPEGSVSLGGWYGAWGLGLDLRSALAYPSLLTIGALRPSLAQPGSAAPAAFDRPLRENSVTASIAGPVARADLALVGQRSRFGDGNVRTTMQLYARYPLAPRLSMIYAGSGIRFSQRSSLYWDPIGYVSNATGLEYAVRRARGLTYAMQVLPGIAWTNESLPGALPLEMRHTATQLTGAGDASYRAESWEAALALSYNRGRAGDYQRVGAMAQVRLTP